QESGAPGPARLVEPQQEVRLPRDDGHARFQGRRGEVRAVRRGLAAGRGDMGPAGVHATDAGWIAAHLRRLRGRDLSRHLPALRPALTLPAASLLPPLLAVPAPPPPPPPPP